MRRIVRVLLMWLLALAVPLQGAAAATMVSCGPGHERLAQLAAAASRDHQPGSASAGPSAAVHDHTAIAAGHGPDSASEPAQPPAYETASLDQLSHFSCSACAACCMGAALPSAGLAFEALRFETHFSPVAPFPAAAFLTGGLDRPPRLLLA